MVVDKVEMAFIENCRRVGTDLKNAQEWRASLKIYLHPNYWKSYWIFLYGVGLNTVFRDLNRHKSDMPLFGAACAAPNKGITVSYKFSDIYFSIISDLFIFPLSLHPYLL